MGDYTTRRQELSVVLLNSAKARCFREDRKNAPRQWVTTECLGKERQKRMPTAPTIYAPPMKVLRLTIFEGAKRDLSTRRFQFCSPIKPEAQSNETTLGTYADSIHPPIQRRTMKRNSKLGFVVSLHLAVFAAAAYPPNTMTGLAFGAASAVILGITLFYEVTG